MVAVQHCGLASKDKAISLQLDFLIARGKTVTRKYPTVTPDLDHLIRAVNDALTGIAFFDDSQVVFINASKVYVSNISEQGVIIFIGYSIYDKPQSTKGN